MSDEAVPPPSPAPIEVVPAQEDKMVAILAYLTPLLCLVGFVIPIIMHSKAKTELGAFHLRQVLGLLCISVANWVVTVILFPLGILISLAIFVLAIMGLISAINGEKKPVPVLGEHFQKWFATVFA